MDYYTVIEKSLFILIVYIHLTSAVSHSLSYFYTGVTPGIHFPEFTAVGLLDGEQIVYYDSNIRKLIPKTDWMKKSEDEDYWNMETQKHLDDQEVFKVNLATAMKRFNQTEGVHTVQWMYGCELDDDGTSTGYMQYGYDGEDFLSLDLKTDTWTAANAKAVITKQKLERTPYYAVFQRAYLENECPDWLLKYVEYGRSTVERKVPPEASLFQKDSSSPVVCHATGFFPKAVMISWQKNGEDLHEEVELRETLPNQDGTFQKRSVLTVSPEELNRHNYTCIIQHSSLEEEMVLQVSDHKILQDGGSVGLIIAAVLAVLLTVLSVCVVLLIQRRNSGFKHVSRSPSSGCESERSSSTISSTSSE
ncbi:H-2 class I histocompatibility antigen, Q10 alpha chain-like isoform X1 [Colossoma macropomum]|uniref:H-2 class I histocompatibility antigen, Q10 alpha chain-like isoform X1 n=1 Tax=Colossoma macropomum TaxID=42526 RepID=UPI001864B66C|nr:H-2 class I histocompatibility antigen, Q10 alpha chain-like isoform X1 [Colossoma macropomum]